MKKILILLVMCFIGCDSDGNLNKIINIPGAQKIYIVDEYGVRQIQLNENSCKEFIVIWSSDSTEITYFCKDELLIEETDITPPK